MSLDARPKQTELIYFSRYLPGRENHPQNTLNAAETAPFEALTDQSYIERLDYHGITSLALHSKQLSPSISQALHSRTALMVANETLKQNALIELFNAFEEANLKRHLLFKGSALAYSIYPQPWLRPRSDSDCFIDKAQQAEVETVLFQLGYQKQFAISGRHVSYQDTYYKPLAGQSMMHLDMHWRINNRQTLAKTYTIDELLARGRPLTNLTPAIHIPSNADSLLIASLHRLGHHHTEERLAWLYDIHLLSKQLQVKDWQTTLELAQEKQLAAITLDALLLSQRLFGTAIPDNIGKQLHQAAQRNEPSQLFLKRNLAEWQYFWHDLKALDGIRPKSRLIMESVFPSAAYVRQQMNTNNTGLAYLKRAWRGFKRIAFKAK